jgi:hypothetical protein
MRKKKEKITDSDLVNYFNSAEAFYLSKYYHLNFCENMIDFSLREIFKKEYEYQHIIENDIHRKIKEQITNKRNQILTNLFGMCSFGVSEKNKEIAQKIAYIELLKNEQRCSNCYSRHVSENYLDDHRLVDKMNFECSDIDEFKEKIKEHFETIKTKINKSIENNYDETPISNLVITALDAADKFDLIKTMTFGELKIKNKKDKLNRGVIVFDFDINETKNIIIKFEVSYNTKTPGVLTETHKSYVFNIRKNNVLNKPAMIEFDKIINKFEIFEFIHLHFCEAVLTKI